MAKKDQFDIETVEELGDLELPLPKHRLRRLRTSPALRALLTEEKLSAADLVFPMFVKDGIAEPVQIESMPGQYQWPLATIVDEARRVFDLGIPAVLLFGIPLHKDASGSSAMGAESVISRAVAAIKQAVPQLLVMTDLCFCEYMDHGHCGVVEQSSRGDWDIHNDKTLALLAEQAVAHANAGADVIAPSGMMDGMVAAVRAALDQTGHEQLPIMSYAVKYASSFYGPFRDAAEGAPDFGDRSTHQMNPANTAEAMREAAVDIEEGADILMVKPAGAYLDIIYQIKQEFSWMPCAAYQVSGEYAMIQAAGERGWLDSQAAMLESLLAIKRAGADFIITYFAKHFAAAGLAE